MLFRLNTQAQFDVIECQSISIQQGWTNTCIYKFWNQYRFVLTTVIDQEKKCIESLMCIGQTQHQSNRHDGVISYLYKRRQLDYSNSVCKIVLTFVFIYRRCLQSQCSQFIQIYMKFFSVVIIMQTNIHFSACKRRLYKREIIVLELIQADSRLVQTLQ